MMCSDLILRGRAEVARQPHKLEVVGSSPTPSQPRSATDLVKIVASAEWVVLSKYPSLLSGEIGDRYARNGEHRKGFEG